MELLKYMPNRKSDNNNIIKTSTALYARGTCLGTDIPFT